MIGKTISHYKILEKLGEGGMGVVYKAQDSKLDRFVALKFLSQYLSSNEEEKKRFIYEAKAASALDHQNIGTIYEINETEDGQIFMAMAYYKGETLKQKIEGGPIAIAEAVDIATQVARGLTIAHQSNIIHRDIKPTNIIINERGEVKIIDFGLAKLVGRTQLTKTGTTMGTACYMSPEQAQGTVVDHRTDIWSFGVVLYEMLTGNLPFKGDYEAALLYCIVHENPQSVSEIRPDIPVKLSNIVNKALQKDSEKRYESMQHIIVDFKGVLDDDSGSAGTSDDSVAPLHKSLAKERKSRISPKRERRQAAIVVSTLTGYDDLVERLEPEEVSDVIEEISNKVAQIADKQDGLVNHFSEEEIVLLFGIPVTHEDDLSRAVRAALELHDFVRKLRGELSERIDEEIRIYSGIDAGVVVAQPHDGEERRFRLTGGPVQIASRLAAEADKDEILISSKSQRLINAFFDTKARKPLKIRGRSQPIRPFAIKGESGFRSRLEAIDSAKLTPFVGRDRELHTLKSGLDKAINGDGQFVTVVGEAGLGKSRLLYEFRNQIDHDIEIKQGHCQSYGSNIPYLPFIELLKELLDIAPEDQNGNQSENIAAQIRVIDANLEDYIPLFLHLLSVENTKYPLPDHLQGDNIQHAIVEGLSAMITLAANKKPMVILFEDWHWVDDASQKIVKQLAEMVSNFPLCLVVTYRPEAVLEWGNPANHTRIQLASLDASSSIGIIKSVLGAKSLPEKLAALIHERTGGNPFFVEEMSQTLQEEGSIKVEKQKILLAESTSKIHLPQTIQAVIRSRLDRLDPDAFEVLRAAAVIGREFKQNILENVIADEMQLGESLQALRNSGLIQQIRVLPEATFRFKHILTQEVAYDSLLLHQRKAIHGLVGEVLEKVYHDRLREHATLLMEHFSQAENWQKAVYYGCEAADHPLKLCQYVNGLNILDKVEAWIPKLPEKEEREKRLIDVLLQKERACESLGYLERQKQVIDQLLKLIDSEDIKRADVYIRLADLFILGNRFKDGEDALDEAIRMSRKFHHKDTELRALRSMSFLKCRSGDDEKAAAITQNVVERDIQIGDATVLAQDLFTLFNIVNRLGDDKRVKKCLDDALALYDQVQPRQRSFIMIMAGLYYRDMGDDDKAISFFKKVHEIVAKYGGKSAFSLISIANIHLKQGNIEEALRYYKEAVDWARKKDFVSDLAIALHAMGSALLSLGRNTEALPYLQEAAEVYSRQGDSENQTSMLGMVATAYEKDGRHKDAFATWEKVREMSKEVGNLKTEIDALKGMARTTRHLAPDPSQALQYYHVALELAEQLKDRTEQGDILNSLAIIEWQSQHFEQAVQHYEKALEIFLEQEDQKHAGFILNSMAATLKKLDRYEEALSRLQEAIQIHQQVDQPLLEGHALAIEGDIYFDLKKLDRARESYEKSLALRQKVSDRKGEGWMSFQLAKVLQAQGSSKQSQDYAEKALAIAKECHEEELLNKVRAFME